MAERPKQTPPAYEGDDDVITESRRLIERLNKAIKRSDALLKSKDAKGKVRESGG